MTKETGLRVRLTFEEFVLSGETVRTESYGARFLEEITAEELAKFASNTVLRNLPEFLKGTK